MTEGPPHDQELIAGLLEAAKDGNRRAIGRLLSIAEAGGPPADELAEQTFTADNEALVVGVTGPPGSGKSTLVGSLVAQGEERRCAVLAVDPTSPVTGGAILGDRVRIDAAAHHTFVRSLATRGHEGGLALAVPGSIRVLSAVGFDPVIIETVGVGQIEVEIAAAADTTVIVANPGTGDGVQANKAGLLEMADIFVVNKSDHPGAQEVQRDLSAMLDLGHVTGGEPRWRPPIVMTNALTGDGTGALWAAIDSHQRQLTPVDRDHHRRQRHLGEVQGRLRQVLAARTDRALATAAGQVVLDDLARAKIKPAVAGDRLADIILRLEP